MRNLPITKKKKAAPQKMPDQVKIKVEVTYFLKAHLAHLKKVDLKAPLVPPQEKVLLKAPLFSPLKKVPLKAPLVPPKKVLLPPLVLPPKKVPLKASKLQRAVHSKKERFQADHLPVKLLLSYPLGIRVQKKQFPPTGK